MRQRQGVLFVLPAIIVLALLVAYPIVYTGVLSVTDNQGAYVGLKNYAAMAGARATKQPVSNTLYYVLGSIVLQVTLGTLVGYGFARFNFCGKAAAQAFILVGQLLPTAAIVVPLFVTLRWLGLVNTWLGLILVYMILTLPLSVWMLTSYFRAIPAELEEAAIIDGARASACSSSPCSGCSSAG